MANQATVQRNTRVTPFPVRTPFQEKTAQGSKNETQPQAGAGVSWPHVKWLQSVATAINGIIITTTVSANYRVAPNDKNVINVNTAAGNINVTLPPANTMLDRQVIVKKISGDGNTVNVLPSGTDLIDGQNSAQFLIPYQSLTFISNGSSWGIY